MPDYNFPDVRRNAINLEQSILHKYVEELDFVETAEITLNYFTNEDGKYW